MNFYRRSELTLGSHRTCVGGRVMKIELNKRTIMASVMLLVLIASGDAQTSGANPATDKMVAVHGHALHVAEAGEGLPVVVFENGLGEDLSTWDEVRPAIAKESRTFAYDRAGLGKSEDSPEPKDLQHLVAELHALLDAAGVPRPCILVGHSLGGAVAQSFAQQYPKEIAGLVLVDPEDNRLLARLHEQLSPELWSDREKALAQAMPNMPPGPRKEYVAFMEQDAAQFTPGTLANVPIVLLTGTQKNPEFPGNPLEQDLKLELQNQFVAANPQTEHILVPESRHYIQNDAPQKVIAAIEKVLAEARAGAAR